MTSLRSAAVAFALGAIALAACRANTDLGQSCKLTQPCDAGTCAVAPDAVQNLLVDYIALGSAECDDLVCIRTASSDNPPNEQTEARGYCTAPCFGDAKICSPDFQGHDKQLVCQRLLLDDAFLEELKQNQPEEYQRTFGNSASSTYCIKPRQ